MGFFNNNQQNQKRPMNQKDIRTQIQTYPRPNINFNPRTPSLKRLKDKTKINIRYALIEPYAYVHIYWDEENYEIVYEVEEPVLDEIEESIREEMISAMRNFINFDVLVDNDMEKLLAYIDKRFKILAVELGMNFSFESYSKIYYYLVRDFLGFNEIDPMLRDFYVEDIECNGTEGPVYIVHRIYRNIKTNVRFTDVDKLASFIEKLAQRAGKYISYANPILDGTLPDGSRINATYT